MVECFAGVSVDAASVGRAAGFLLAVCGVFVGGLKARAEWRSASIQRGCPAPIRPDAWVPERFVIVEQGTALAGLHTVYRPGFFRLAVWMRIGFDPARLSDQIWPDRCRARGCRSIS